MNSNQLTLDLVRDILVKELGLDDERVNIYNQKWKIPPTEGLYIVVEYRGSPKILSSRNGKASNGLELEEHQEVNALESLSIILFSKDLSALQMKERAVMALYSVYSQQIQESNGFKIFRNPTVVDVSEAEASARLYRFDIEVKVLAWYTNVKATDFFDSHKVRVLVNDGVPDVDEEFTIPVEDPTAYPQT